MHIQVVWAEKLMGLLEARTHARTHAHAATQTGDLAYAIKDTTCPGSSEAVCPRCLQHAKLGSSGDSQLRRTMGIRVHFSILGASAPALEAGLCGRQQSLGEGLPEQSRGAGGSVSRGRAHGSPGEFTNLQGRI